MSMSIGSYNILLKRVEPHPLIDPRATYIALGPPKPHKNPQATQLPLLIHDELMPQFMRQQNPVGYKLHPH